MPGGQLARTVAEVWASGDRAGHGRQRPDPRAGSREGTLPASKTRRGAWGGQMWEAMACQRRGIVAPGGRNGQG
jgi:hypothetical protein